MKRRLRTTMHVIRMFVLALAVVFAGFAASVATGVGVENVDASCRDGQAYYPYYDGYYMVTSGYYNCNSAGGYVSVAMWRDGYYVASRGGMRYEANTMSMWRQCRASSTRHYYQTKLFVDGLEYRATGNYRYLYCW